MTITLSKGGNISLSKEAPGMSKMQIGLGWDLRTTSGDAFDLDASVFLLKADGKARSQQDFVFYNNLKSSDGSIEHTGDNLDGAGEGDDEVIKVELSKIPQEIEKIAICVTIHEADQRRQNFGMVNSAFIRVVNPTDSSEVARYDLSEDASVETAMVFGELYRNAGEWKFKAIGQGYKGGLKEMANQYGIQI